MGIKADPRGEAGVKKYLARKKAEYEELPKSKKEEFDPEDLKNPYSDSRILLGKSSLKVDKVMAGIDIDAAEVVLADSLNQKTKKRLTSLLPIIRWVRHSQLFMRLWICRQILWPSMGFP